MNDYINDAFTREGENTNLEINNLNVGCITSKNNKFELDSNGNLTVNTINASNVVGAVLADSIYPVGSIYLSVNSTNPGLLFGGVWEQIKDKFLLGCGDEYENGETGGSTKHSHKESTAYGVINGQGYVGIALENNQNESIEGLFGATVTTVNAPIPNAIDGVRFSTHESNHLPPYLTIYMWKRIG